MSNGKAHKPVVIDSWISFDGWDPVDTFEFNLYDCVVLRPFGPYKEGDNLETCSVNYETGEFIVWDADDSAEDKEGETSVKEAWKGVLQMRIVEGSVEAE